MKEQKSEDNNFSKSYCFITKKQISKERLVKTSFEMKNEMFCASFSYKKLLDSLQTNKLLRSSHSNGVGKRKLLWTRTGAVVDGNCVGECDANT